jgi:hypothetical protein
MWIIPTNYPQSSVFAPDMVESSEDLALPGLNIEQSLMWRSKPSQLRTWSQRWKRDSWFQRLSGRILKPCQHSAFESELTCLLAVIPASRLAPLGYAKAQKTPDTSGHTSSDTSRQLDLFAASSKMLKDTSALDSEKSLQTWKALVTRLRGEYSARLKSARLIRESECTFWPTPTAQDNNQVKGNPEHPKRGTTLGGAVRQWPTPRTTDTHQGRGVVEINGKLYRPSKALSEGKLIGGANLADSVKMFPTPTANEDAAGTPSGKMQKMLGNDPAVRGTTQAEWSAGALSADWVEGLMGLPAGWTDLGKWGSSE